MKNVFPALVLSGLLAASCDSSPATRKNTATPPPTEPVADTLQQAVAKYIQNNATAFPSYQSVRWSRPVVYTKMREAAIKGVVAMQAFDEALVPRNKALADYKASMARHDTPAQTEVIKARYGKANKYNDSLLAIANSFIGVTDTTRLGVELTHTYRAKNQQGAVVLDSATFVVYPTGEVKKL
jgi:hypothetical protein